MEKLASAEVAEKDAKQSKKPSKSSPKTMKKDQKKKDGENASLTRKSNANSSDSEEPDFWVPPIGSRWDFDNGRDRWESCTSPGHGTDDGTGLGNTKLPFMCGHLLMFSFFPGFSHLSLIYASC